MYENFAPKLEQVGNLNTCASNRNPTKTFGDDGYITLVLIVPPPPIAPEANIRHITKRQRGDVFRHGIPQRTRIDHLQVR